jgi:hypothetical protein
VAGALVLLWLAQEKGVEVEKRTVLGAEKPVAPAARGETRDRLTRRKPGESQTAPTARVTKPGRPVSLAAAMEEREKEQRGNGLWQEMQVFWRGAN